MKAFIFLLALIGVAARAENPVPLDQNNRPIYSGTGRPIFSEAVTLTGTTYTVLLSLSVTGENYNRSFKGIAVRNPDAAHSVYICIGTSTGCSTDSMKIPATYGLALDQIYFGPMNSSTTIWGKLEAAGSVVPEVTVW